MNGSQLNASAGRLQEALEQLLVAWDHTRAHWTDEQARRFEEEHVRPLAQEVTLALPAIAHMAQVLGQAGRECDE